MSDTTYESFDAMLANLHDGGKTLVDADVKTDSSNVISIDNKRQFKPAENFNKEIAYEGDINSQIITFKLPKFHESHDLSKCSNKEIRWKNLNSGLEGNTPLKNSTDFESTTEFCLEWRVKPETCAQAGKLEISITIYDKIDNYIAFSWNTAGYSELSIAPSMDSVNFSFPAKNEILIVDKESKEIVAPKGYNNTICLYGDVGTSNVYFLVNRFIDKNRELDTLTADTAIYIIANGYRKKYVFNSLVDGSTKKLYTANILNEEKDSLVFIKWEVPPDITSNKEIGAAKLKISIEFSKKGEETEDGNPIIIRRWLSDTYNDLKIGESLIQADATPDGPTITEQKVFELITEYFKVYDVTFENE